MPRGSLCRVFIFHISWGIYYYSMLTQYDELRAARGRTLALEHDTTQEIGEYGGHLLRTDSSLLSRSGLHYRISNYTTSNWC